MQIRLMCINALTKCRILKDRVSYVFTLCRIWYEKYMGKYKGIIKTIIDFFVFWLVFEWKNGLVIDFLSESIGPAHAHLKAFFTSGGNLLAVLWGCLVTLSPFGRDMAQNPEFRYCLVIGTVCVALAFAFYLYGLNDEFNWFISLLLSSIAAFSMWYLFYFMCLLLCVYKISFWFHVLAFLASVVLSLISFGIILAVLIVFTM